MKSLLPSVRLYVHPCVVGFFKMLCKVRLCSRGVKRVHLELIGVRSIWVKWEHAESMQIGLVEIR